MKPFQRVGKPRMSWLLVSIASLVLGLITTMHAVAGASTVNASRALRSTRTADGRLTAWHGSSREAAASAPCNDPNVMYNANSGKVAEVFHSQTGDGARVDQWGYDNTNTQKWCFFIIGYDNGDEPVYEIMNYNSRKCMNVKGARPVSGSDIDEWTCNDSAAQGWLITYAGPDGGSNFVTQLDINTGKVYRLEVYHSGTSNGDKVDIWLENNSATQAWCPVKCT